MASDLATTHAAALAAAKEEIERLQYELMAERCANGGLQEQVATALSIPAADALRASADRALRESARLRQELTRSQTRMINQCLRDEEQLREQRTATENERKSRLLTEGVNGRLAARAERLVAQLAEARAERDEARAKVEVQECTMFNLATDVDGLMDEVERLEGRLGEYERARAWEEEERYERAVPSDGESVAERGGLAQWEASEDGDDEDGEGSVADLGEAGAEDGGCWEAEEMPEWADEDSEEGWGDEESTDWVDVELWE